MQKFPASRSLAQKGAPPSLWQSLSERHTTQKPVLVWHTPASQSVPPSTTQLATQVPWLQSGALVGQSLFWPQ
jgi:hypothetical protein